MTFEPIDVLRNLQKYDLWKVRNYGLCEGEARVIIEIMEEYIRTHKAEPNNDKE